MMAATMEAFRRSLQRKDGAEITEIAVGLFAAKEALEIQLKEFRNASSAMALEYQQMKDEVRGLRKENENLRKQNMHLTGIQTIQTNDLFGRSTEKTEDLLDRVTSEEQPQDPLAEDDREQDTKAIQRENRKRLKSVASPSLLAQIMLDWKHMYLPLYRQEFDPERFGFNLSRQTMSHWIGYVVHTHLLSVYEHLCSLLKLYRCQHCDETYWQVVLDERKPGAKSFIWVHRSGEFSEGHQIVACCYEKTRGADHLRSFYGTLLEMIYLTCDAYGAYSAFADESSEMLILTGCWMHCRRRLVEAALVLKVKGLSEEQVGQLPEIQAIFLIRDIYLAENPLKELSASERLSRRLKEVKPKVDAFFAYIRTVDLSNPLVSEKLRDAVQYALNQEICLRRFLEDGSIPIDNGACERSVKPVALSRRNSLFSLTGSGAESSVMIQTLIEAARANGADPYYYLKYLMEQMPKYLYAKGREYLQEMMPWSERYRRYKIRERTNAP